MPCRSRYSRKTSARISTRGIPLFDQRLNGRAMPASRFINGKPRRMTPLISGSGLVAKYWSISCGSKRRASLFDDRAAQRNGVEEEDEVGGLSHWQRQELAEILLEVDAVADAIQQCDVLDLRAAMPVAGAVELAEFDGQARQFTAPGFGRPVRQVRLDNRAAMFEDEKFRGQQGQARHANPFCRQTFQSAGFVVHAAGGPRERQCARR